ncbi:Proline dehydrogenase (EC / Delta-1-pyrroline-5-carboxylate dehydrogenase (EC [Olavius algarvensis Delta 1 endosymbiont]|nr:Proline dehydrogenase (EC / Delta-1-pyrroline-5-carboxylate dehydrogenase (EC [Olavius algarvensis Delta 1 endosymbiont]
MWDKLILYLLRNLTCKRTEAMNDTDKLVADAVQLATKWQNRANELRTPREKARHNKLAQLFTNPKDKVILTALIDQCFRSADNRRVADQLHFLLTDIGIPTFFSPVEKFLILLFLHAGRFIPGLTVPRIIKKMRRDTSHLIIPGERQTLETYLQKRKSQGLKTNINHIGEEVLGEDDAAAQLKMYMDDIKNPAVEHISVKISTIFSQIQPLAFDQTVGILTERLTSLYRTAAETEYVRPDGTRVQKFVHLDMEAYRDLAITAEAFMQTLDQAEFKNFSAGMALQAYLPDSYHILQQITAWAGQRVKKGGSPVKIRIVKGANMEMELIESALFDWPLAPFDGKVETDANWKRMVTYGMQPENVKAVRLGIASHNLFDIAYAYLVAQYNKVTDYFNFEMIEGMANHVRRTIQETGQELVVYAPVATEKQFIHAIAYLIRRLDENTGPKNFLQHLNRLQTNNRSWQFLTNHFKSSIKQMQHSAGSPHRSQNRLTEVFSGKTGTYYEAQFQNEPNTDWSLTGNRQWAAEIRKKWQKQPGDEPMEIPLVVNGQEVFAGRRLREIIDPSRVKRKIVVARFAMANAADIDKAVKTAGDDPGGWRRKTHRQRHRILAKVAVELRRARGDLIGAAAANTGKVFTEADVEVSEAVDFAEYYPHSAGSFFDIDHLQCRGKGVGVVISPWNFPIAIPCGGIAASLAAGNTVIFKPASDAVLVAWEVCQCFWRAGVPKSVLQFVPCSGSTTGVKLTNHPGVDYIILTGGTQTGLAILNQRPDIFLAAETGGKNATIVTDMSDRDQAISDVIYSAFGNCGQKCSATSLLILERAVYEDPAFKRQLVDAARSFASGSAWDFSNKMGPLIHPPRDDLARALTELESGETWALKPENMAGNPNLWTPGIKWGVKPGSTTHLTEFFGPLLGVLPARDLKQAIEIVNQTGYGLTSGIETLDRREQDYWSRRIKAGNLYINRGTTGAVTLRQPFGGIGKSALGAGIKAGSPKYVAQFMEYQEKGLPMVGPVQQNHTMFKLAQRWQRQLDWGDFDGIEPDMQKSIRAIKSYLYHCEQEYSREIDYFHLRGQDNILRYIPVGTVVVRLHPADSLFDALARIAAAKITGCKLLVSIPAGLDNPVTRFLQGKEGRRLLGEDPVSDEPDDRLIKSIPQVNRIRYAAPDRVPAAVFKAAAETGFYISRTPVYVDGRLELLQYYQQQSICRNYHRYGNLGDRTLE